MHSYVIIVPSNLQSALSDREVMNTLFQMQIVRIKILFLPVFVPQGYYHLRRGSRVVSASASEYVVQVRMSTALLGRRLITLSKLFTHIYQLSLLSVRGR